MKGRPIRFLAAALAVWTGARTVALWPVDEVPVLSVPMLGAAMAAEPPKTRPLRHREALDQHGFVMMAAPQPLPTRALGQPTSLIVASARQAVQVAPPITRPPAADLPPPVAPPPLARARSRLGGSVWVVARGGASAALLGGQLGASQAGARLTYALGAARRVAIAARVATPLGGSGREAAIGFDWQPTSAPVHLIAEQRFALDGGRGGPTVGVIGGVGPTEVARGITVEGYAQAGAIARDRIDGFIDGSLRVTTRLHEQAGSRIDLGLGAWGGAQRGAARLDVGPTLGVVLPVGPRRLRLAADWRQRVAGDARPGSGPAISIGSDF